MSEIITYKNSPSGKYCQIKLNDGKRILISIAQPGIKIIKMKWGGTIPDKDIFEISTEDLFSEEYKFARERLTERSLELDMLDVFKEILLPCTTLDEVEHELSKIFQRDSQEDTDDYDTGEVLGALLLQYLSREGSLDWLKKMFPKTSEEKLLNEYLAFDIFKIILAIQSIYKDDPEGPRLSKVFNKYINDELVKAKLFKDDEEYKEFMKPRLDTYDEDIRENKEPNYIYWISKHFCEYIGEDLEMSTIMGISEYFAQTIKADIDLVKEVTKKKRN